MIRLVWIFVLMLTMNVASFGQSASLTLSGYSFSYSPEVYTSIPLTESDKLLHYNFMQAKNLLKNETPVVTEFIHPTVRYDAFFCRLEQKSVHKLGIWFKIHAGKYDRYMHRDSYYFKDMY